MNYLLGILALAVGFFTTPCMAQTGPGNCPTDTVVGNIGGGTTCLISIIGQRSGQWYLDNTPPVNELRWKDKFFGGDAAVHYPNMSGPFLGSSCAHGDWFSNFFNTTRQGSCSYLGIFQMIGEIDASISSSSGGILGAAQTLNVGSNQGTIGTMGYTLNNHPNGTINFGGWGGYFECDQLVSNATGCLGFEVDVANIINDAYAGAPDPFQQTGLNSLQLACGSGFGTFPTVYKCGTASQIVNNGAPYIIGISFQSNSIAPQTIFGGPVSPAIVMATGYGILWYSAAGTPQGGIEINGSNTLTIAAPTITINGTAAANCASGTVNAATVVVINGIVTHC